MARAHKLVTLEGLAKEIEFLRREIREFKEEENKRVRNQVELMKRMLSLIENNGKYIDMIWSRMK